MKFFTLVPILFLSIFIMISSAWAQANMFVTPLSHNKELSVAMSKSFDAHIRNLLKGSTQVIDFESTQTAINAVGCKPQCGTKKAIVELANKVQPRFIFSGHMKLEDETYQFKVTLFDAAHKKLYNLKTNCEFCDETEVKNKIKALIKAKAFQKILAKTAPVKKKEVTSFSVEIASVPEGANVRIKKKVLGQTPMRIELKPGEYKIKLGKKGFQKHVFDVKTPKDASQPVKLSHTLKPLMQTLTVKSTPKGASVYVDGTLLKDKTPLKHKMTVETHSVRLALEGYEDFVKEFKAHTKAKHTVKIDAKLKKAKKEKAIVAPVVAAPTAKPSVKTPTPALNSNLKKPAFLNPTYGGTLLALGTIATGVGTWLVFLHGDPACTDGRDRTACPEIYDTRAIGYTSLIFGMAAFGSGLTTLLLNPHWPGSTSTKKNTSKSQAFIAPTTDGVVLQWGARF